MIIYSKQIKLGLSSEKCLDQFIDYRPLNHGWTWIRHIQKMNMVKLIWIEYSQEFFLSSMFCYSDSDKSHPCYYKFSYKWVYLKWPSISENNQDTLVQRLHDTSDIFNFNLLVEQSMLFNDIYHVQLDVSNINIFPTENKYMWINMWYVKQLFLKQISIKHSASVDEKWSTGDVKWKIPETSLKHLNIYIFLMWKYKDNLNITEVFNVHFLDLELTVRTSPILPE